MDVIILTTIDEFANLKNDWERIERVAHDVTYFSTFRYNYDWWFAHKNDGNLTLFIVVCLVDGKTVGIAPLQLKKIKCKFYSYVELQFLHGGGDYSNFIVDPDVSYSQSKVIDDILQKIRDCHQLYDTIRLTHISQHTLLAYRILVSPDNKNLRYLVECPYIDFSKYSSFDDYTRAFLPKKIKQYINRFKREVYFSFNITSDNIIDEMSVIHIAEKQYLKDKGRLQRHSLFENESEMQFRKTLYKDNNNVLTYLLRDNKDNNIICYYTGYVKGGIFHSVTTAYNPEYSRLAVGKIFNYLIFEENFARPKWKVFDMGTGRYFWKFEMTDTFNLLYEFVVERYRSSWSKIMRKLEKIV